MPIPERYLNSTGFSLLDIFPTDKSWSKFSELRDKKDDTPANYRSRVNSDLFKYNAFYVERDVAKMGNPFYVIRFRTEEDLVFFKLKFT